MKTRPFWRGAAWLPRLFATRSFWPRGLFPKIFGWFLAAQLVLALALYLLALATQRGLDSRFNEMIGESLEARVRAAAIAYENGGQTAVREAWMSSPRDASSPSLERPEFDRPEFDRPGFEPPGLDRPEFDRPDIQRPDIQRPDVGSSEPTPGANLRRLGERRNARRRREIERGIERERARLRGMALRRPERRALNDVEASALYLLSESTPSNPGSASNAAPHSAANSVTNSAALSVAAPTFAHHLAGPVAPSANFEVPPGLTPGENTILPLNGVIYLLRRVDTARGGRFLGVVTLRPGGGRPRGPLDGWIGGPRGALGAAGGVQNGALWRILVTALTMGALCYALARYLTDPAIKLRRATRSFAAGDFGTRVGPQMGHRRDELADLGHDFDQMAERIENLLLSQRQLLGDISHELRSPLTRLSLALELALPTANETTRGYLQRIEAEVSELGGLIGQLLTLTRLENTSLDVSAQSREAAYIDLAHLVEHVAQNADFEAKNRGGSVQIVRSEACDVVGNGELLHSALENVVRNAILHSPGTPRVEISLQIENHSPSNPNFGSNSPQQIKRDKKARMAVIRVRDFGVGVPEEALELLFRPFYRVAEGRARQSGGTGLGLSIAQRAARFHGGDVSALNAPGGGLEVRISLPLSDVVNSSAAAEELI